MKRKDSFFTMVCSLAIPVALQSMLQASFSIADQIMIGQLGETSVAGVGLAGKFTSIVSVVVSAIGAVAGIMISQYMGQREKGEVRKSYRLNLALAIAIAALSSVACAVLPGQIMGLYTKDLQTRLAAAGYLRIVSVGFWPMACATLISTMLRCMEKARLPLYASIASAILNTGLNYMLIFGKCGCRALGAEGAAIATVVSQYAGTLAMILMLRKNNDDLKVVAGEKTARPKINWKQYADMLLPVLVCEFVWSLGENVYAAIYGHMGTEASAAMTLINPVQGLMIGALCGLSQAASVIIGKKLGNKEYDGAYLAAKRLILYGLVGSVVLSGMILVTSAAYVEIYQVEQTVKQFTRQILIVYAVIAPFKVLNMILGGGIIRSGGKTKYVMCIDMIGTWGFGVPLGLLSAFVLKLSIPWVYFILSLEECVRFGISMVVLRRKNWMHSLQSAEV